MWQLVKRKARPGILLLAGGISCMAITASLMATVASGFRVTPYIQNPSQEAVTLIWFSASNSAGKIELHWKGADGEKHFRTVKSIPTMARALGYHPVEIDEFFSTIEPPPQPFHHEVRLSGLAPGTAYRYLVVQDNHQAGGTFRTQGGKDRTLRFIVYADSETEPESSGKAAAWPGIDIKTENRLYPVDQSTGYRENLKLIADRHPDFIAIAGDLVQSGGEQRDWDEFWRHNASLAASTPIFPALGNHEYFGGPRSMGQYGMTDSERAVRKYQTYFDLPGNGAGNSAHDERYYAITHGPVSLLVLDLNNGAPHQGPQDPNWRLLGENDGGVAPEWQPGSTQYKWLEQELATAQKASRFTFVMFHNCPYSSGVHGLPPGASAGMDILSGLPLRALTPLFLKYGVDALLTGHDEMYEHSVVSGQEQLANGQMADQLLHVFDVGIGGDGLRGPIDGLVNANQTFLAHTDAPEIYDEDGILVAGGKHYGHLEVNVTKNAKGRWQARMDMVYVFPVMDAQGHVSGFERRLYKDTTVLTER